MANYDCVSRTSYFRTTDPDALENLVSNIISEDEINFWSKEEDGITRYAFGGRDTLGDYAAGTEEDSDDLIYGSTFEALQQLIPDDETIIIMEAGSEKLRYINSYAWIITKTEIKFLDLLDYIKESLPDPEKELPEIWY